jgi:hypothetical protein
MKNSNNNSSGNFKIFDDKILENLFDSEIESDDLDDNEYGDVDSK